MLPVGHSSTRGLGALGGTGGCSTGTAQQARPDRLDDQQRVPPGRGVQPVRLGTGERGPADLPGDRNPLLQLRASGPTAAVTALAFGKATKDGGQALYAGGYDKVVHTWVCGAAGAFTPASVSVALWTPRWKIPLYIISELRKRAPFTVPRTRMACLRPAASATARGTAT